MAADAVRLVLLRHGEAERVAERDELRPLTAAGRAESQRAAAAIATLGAAGPYRIVCSPFLRARETAGIVSAELADGAVQMVRGISPDDDPRRALAALEGLLVPGGVLVAVTHMPLIGALFGLLEHGDQRQSPGVATASGALFAGELLAPGLMRRVSAIEPRDCR